MASERKPWVLLFVVLLLSSMFVSVSAQDSHENFDDAEADIKALYVSLNRTSAFMVGSLNYSLNVNYSQEVGEDTVTYRYNSSNIDFSEDSAIRSMETVSGSEEILDDIEGDVGSYVYLEGLYLPYDRASENLSSFCTLHEEFLHNLTNSIEIYNEYSPDSKPVNFLNSGLESLNHASVTLRDMKRSLENMRELIESVDDEKLDNEELLGHLSSVRVMMDGYQEEMEDVLMLYKSIPSYVGLMVPGTSHPGEYITISGVYIESGEYVPGKEVELYVEGEYANTSITGEDGFFKFDYRVPWTEEFGPLNFSARVIEGDNYKNATTSVERYISSIELLMDKKQFYMEDIELHGTFKTKADVPLDQLEISATGGKELSPFENGSFTAVYESREFRWGTATVDVSYTGNRTINGCSSSISFNVTVPTALTLHSEVSGKIRELERTGIMGALRNRSSGEALDGQKITILLDGREISTVFTGDQGMYSDVLNLKTIGLTEGMHKLKAVFEGAGKYRSTGSDVIYLYKTSDGVSIGDDPDKVKDEVDGEEGFMDFSDVGWFVISVSFLILISVLVVFYYRKYEGEEEGQEEPSRKVLRKKEYNLTASSAEDIPRSYRSFVEKLEHSGTFNLTRGKTHRDLSRELTAMTGLDEQVRTVTELFERTYFSGKKIDGSALEDYNNGISQIDSEVFG